MALRPGRQQGGFREACAGASLRTGRDAGSERISQLDEIRFHIVRDRLSGRANPAQLSLPILIVRAVRALSIHCSTATAPIQTAVDASPGRLNDGLWPAGALPPKDLRKPFRASTSLLDEALQAGSLML